MATIKELLSSYKVNEPITDKRILSHFKKLGYIWDYSKWGYLESVIIHTSDSSEYAPCVELFASKNAKELEQYPMAVYIEGNKVYRQSSARTDIPTTEKIREKFVCGHFEWNGYKFRTKYFSGCFQPYLVISEK